MYMYPYISHLFRCFIQKWSPVLRNDTESAIDSIPIKSFQKKSALRLLQTAFITIQFVLNDHMADSRQTGRDCKPEIRSSGPLAFFFRLFCIVASHRH